MDTFKSKLNSILSELKIISDQTKVAVRPKIRELAKILEEGILNENSEILSKTRAALAGHSINPEIIEIKHISILIKKMKEEYFPNVSDRNIEVSLEDKYKMKDRVSQVAGTKRMDIESISNEELYLVKDQLKDRIRSIESGGAKDIKIKANKTDIEQYDWQSPLAYELAKLAIKMEAEYPRQDPKYIKEISKHVRLARDGRFATPLQNYEAIIVASNATTSLKDVVEGEWTFKSRWEIEDDEHHCRECKSRLLECATKKCRCVCHQVIKPMTTKGLKYAINTDEKLKKLNDYMAAIMKNDYMGACGFGKMLLRNPEQKRRLAKSDIKKILALHVTKDDCQQCEQYLDEI